MAPSPSVSHSECYMINERPDSGISQALVRRCSAAVALQCVCLEVVLVSYAQDLGSKFK